MNELTKELASDRARRTFRTLSKQTLRARVPHQRDENSCGSRKEDRDTCHNGRARRDDRARQLLAHASATRCSRSTNEVTAREGTDANESKSNRRFAGLPASLSSRPMAVCRATRRSAFASLRSWICGERRLFTHGRAEWHMPSLEVAVVLNFASPHRILSVSDPHRATEYRSGWVVGLHSHHRLTEAVRGIFSSFGSLRSERTCSRKRP
jgi:hypothetical protein